jgi:hypothetical protein
VLWFFAAFTGRACFPTDKTRGVWEEADGLDTLSTKTHVTLITFVDLLVIFFLAFDLAASFDFIHRTDGYESFSYSTVDLIVAQWLLSGKSPQGCGRCFLRRWATVKRPQPGNCHYLGFLLPAPHFIKSLSDKAPSSFHRSPACLVFSYVERQN